MHTGRLVRIEEITRCLPEVQDALISVLSERRMMIPELDGSGGSVFAAPGFNVIATANLRDRGVSEMSAALKRRLNFENRFRRSPDAKQEVELVRSRVPRRVLGETGTTVEVDRARLLDLLVTTFRDLRDGRTGEGWTVERPAAVMSTAEAVTVAALAITRQGTFFPSKKDPVSLLVVPAISSAWFSKTIKKTATACSPIGTARFAAAARGTLCGNACTNFAGCSKKRMRREWHKSPDR